MLKNKKYSKYIKMLGFTLAETLTVISVLGIVAAITIPSVYFKNKQTIHKTQIKKSMQVYDSAIRRLKAEHNLSNEEKFDNYVNAAPNCARTSVYFIKAEGSGCVFKTIDGIWWDISNIRMPIVAFSRDALTRASENDVDYRNSFAFITSIDNENLIRVNDLMYLSSNEISDYIKIKNLYSFINGQDIYVPEYQNYLNGNSGYKECDPSLSSTERRNCYYVATHYKAVEKQAFGKTVIQNVEDGYSKYVYGSDNNLIAYDICEDSAVSNCREKEAVTAEHIGNIQIQRGTCESTAMQHTSDMCQSDGTLTFVTEYLDGKPHDNTVRYIKTHKEGCDTNAKNCRFCTAYNGATCEIDRVEGDTTYYK